LALFRATIKYSGTTNGINYQEGMSVDFTSSYSAPLNTNSGTDVANAFTRTYGLDIKRAGILSFAYIHVERI
jgi:hypothetical protein